MTRFKRRVRARAFAAAAAAATGLALGAGAAPASASPPVSTAAPALGSSLSSAVPAATSGSGWLCRNVSRYYCGIVYNKGRVALGVGSGTGGPYKLLYPGRWSDTLWRDTGWIYGGPGYRLFVSNAAGKMYCYNTPLYVFLGDARYSAYAEKGRC